MTHRVVISEGDPPADPGLEAPPHVKDGPNGSAVVDPDVTPPTGGDDPPAGDRPEWLPEKFESPEALAQAYAELEQKLSGGSGDDPPTDPPTDPPADPPAGLDMEALSKEWSENEGQLSEDTLADLESKGISRAVVDAYVQGLQAQAAQQRAQLAQAVGGEDSLKNLLAWSAKNLSEAQANAYNAALDDGNLALAETLLSGFNAQMIADVGKDPTLVNGTPAPTAGIKPFDSWAQVQEAMRDPKYDNDSAYRKTVEKRLAVSAL